MSDDLTHPDDATPATEQPRPLEHFSTHDLFLEIASRHDAAVLFTYRPNLPHARPIIIQQAGPDDTLPLWLATNALTLLTVAYLRSRTPFPEEPPSPP